MQDTTGGTKVQDAIFNPVGLAFHNFAGLGNVLFVSSGTGDHSFVQAYDGNTTAVPRHASWRRATAG